LRRPLLINQNNTADDLDSRQASLLSGVLHQLQDHGIELLIMDKLFNILTAHTVLAGNVLQRFFLGHDDGDGFGFLGICVHADVIHNWCGTVS
jgi:hypothetical protein